MSEAKISIRTYSMVFGALWLLTALTAGVAWLNLGPFNLPVALLIACTKAVLVILIFMHVRYSSRLIWVVAAAGFYWVGIMLVLTLSDYLSRGWDFVPMK